MEAVAKARLAAGLPALRPDGSPYVRGPYKPRAPKTASAAGGGKEERQKSGRQPGQPDQKVKGSASYEAPHNPTVQESSNLSMMAKAAGSSIEYFLVESNVLVALCCSRVELRAASTRVSADAARLLCE